MKKNLVFVISSDITSGEYGHVKAAIVERDPETSELLGFRSDYEDKEYEYYQDLIVDGQTHRGNKDGSSSYGWKIMYRPFTVTEREAGKMYKTLSKLNKKMDKYYNEEGQADTFGEYVSRVAKAAGVKEFVTVNNGIRNSFIKGHLAITAIDAMMDAVNSKLNN